jgi:hypothetical protein
VTALHPIPGPQAYDSTPENGPFYWPYAELLERRERQTPAQVTENSAHDEVRHNLGSRIQTANEASSSFCSHRKLLPISDIINILQEDVSLPSASSFCCTSHTKDRFREYYLTLGLVRASRYCREMPNELAANMTLLEQTTGNSPQTFYTI